jgi:hypothetical protein
LGNLEVHWSNTGVFQFVGDNLTKRRDLFVSTRQQCSLDFVAARPACCDTAHHRDHLRQKTTEDACIESNRAAISLAAIRRLTGTTLSRAAGKNSRRMLRSAGSP